MNIKSYKSLFPLKPNNDPDVSATTQEMMIDFTTPLPTTTVEQTEKPNYSMIPYLMRVDHTSADMMIVSSPLVKSYELHVYSEDSKNPQVMRVEKTNEAGGMKIIEPLQPGKELYFYFVFVFFNFY